MSELVDQIKSDVLEAQRFSRKHLVLELDYSAGSIQELESQVDTLGYAIQGGASDENITMLTRVWGAYIGEALRKASGGEWVEEDGRIALRSDKATVYPHEQVKQRLDGDASCNLSEYFARTVAEL